MKGIRKTYRLSDSQHRRLLALRMEMSRRAGSRVSWQLVMSTAVEAGLRELGYPESNPGDGEGQRGEADGAVI
jgi:hypothetical protein